MPCDDARLVHGLASAQHCRNEEADADAAEDEREDGEQRSRSQVPVGELLHYLDPGEQACPGERQGKQHEAAEPD